MEIIDEITPKLEEVKRYKEIFNKIDAIDSKYATWWYSKPNAVYIKQRKYFFLLRTKFHLVLDSKFASIDVYVEGKECTYDSCYLEKLGALLEKEGFEVKAYLREFDC